MSSKYKILIVEDNEDNLMLLMDVLVTMDVEIFTARDGQTGVDSALAEEMDLILMDLSLPILDGWKATKILKANPSTQHVPIIALTAHAMMGDRERALEIGCDDYVSKPINLRELLTLLKEYLPDRD